MKVKVILTCSCAMLAMIPGRSLGQDANEVRALVAQMLSDAETRTTLLQSGSHAGHDSAFFLQDATGDFRLEVGGFMQYRYVASFRDSTTSDPGDFEGGFQMRILRIAFQGHVFDPSLQFKVSQTFSRSGGQARLSDGYVKKTWDSGLTLRAGQFKLPFLFEELTSAKRQLTAGRSITNDVFTLKRSKGVELSYERDRWRAWGAYSNGGRSTDKDFAQESTRWALTGRIEHSPLGSLDPFQQGGASHSSKFAAMIGAAVHIEENEADDQFGANSIRWTIDGALRGDRWSLGTAIISRMDSAANAGSTAHDWGALVQGSVLIGEYEPFIRYDILMPDRNHAANDNFTTITIGTNYYLHSHSAKLTLDMQWSLDDPSQTSIVSPSTGTTLLNAQGNNQVAIRAQVQVLF